jgi:hypothetical protein
VQHSRKAPPRHAPPLAPTVQPLPPGARELLPKALQAAEIPRHPVVLKVPTEHAAQIPPLDLYREMPVLPAPRGDPTDRPPQPPGGGPTADHKPPRATPPTNVSQPEEVKGLWLLVPPGPAFLGKAPKLNEPGLRVVQPQAKLPQSRAKRLREPCRVVRVLEGTHE